MKCPSCSSNKIRCSDSRPINGTIRRRKVCKKCGKRFSTLEIIANKIKNRGKQGCKLSIPEYDIEPHLKKITQIGQKLLDEMELLNKRLLNHQHHE